MDRVRRVQEERRRAGTRQSGGDLLADDARLAHPRQDDAPAALTEQVDSPIEPLVEAIDERENRGGFGLKHFPGEAAISHGPAWRCPPV